jgi:hypothetical protein
MSHTFSPCHTLSPLTNLETATFCLSTAGHTIIKSGVFLEGSVLLEIVISCGTGSEEVAKYNPREVIKIRITNARVLVSISINGKTRI